MPDVLTDKQIEDYRRDGYIVVADVLSPETLRAVDAVTADFVEKSRDVTAHDTVYDLEDGHSAQEPRIRRIRSPHRRHPVYAALVRHPTIVGILKDIVGPNLRFQQSKLNMKSAAFGSPVEWHQDWAVYPHSNDDMAAVGIMLDDCDLDNGPLLMIPGSHRGPVFNHHRDGVFCGAIDPNDPAVDFTKAVPLLGKAGAITVHHVRMVHGSAPNDSGADRRLLLQSYRAADAWPIYRVPGDMADYDAMMVAGEPTLEPRLAPVPVRIPMPTPIEEGSIYARQKDLKDRYFADPKRALAD